MAGKLKSVCQYEPPLNFKQSTVRGIMLAGAVYPAVVAAVFEINFGDYKFRALEALSRIFIIGGIGSFFAFAFTSILGALSILIISSLADVIKLSGDRLWVAISSGGLTGLMWSGYFAISLLSTNALDAGQRMTYWLIGTATILGQIGGWLGARKVIHAAKAQDIYFDQIEMPRFRLRLVLAATTIAALLLGAMTYIKLPIVEILGLFACWFIFQAITMGVLIGFEALLYKVSGKH